MDLTSRAQLLASSLTPSPAPFALISQLQQEAEKSNKNEAALTKTTKVRPPLCLVALSQT